jgi:hypothetical protein
MFTHDLLTFIVRLLILDSGLFLPGGFSDLSVSLCIGIDRRGKLGKKALGSFMGKVFGVLEGNLSSLLRVINQGAGPEEVV